MKIIVRYRRRSSWPMERDKATNQTAI